MKPPARHNNSWFEFVYVGLSGLTVESSLQSTLVPLASHQYLAPLPLQLLTPKLPFSPSPCLVYRQALLVLPLLACLSKEGNTEGANRGALLGLPR